MLGQTRRGWRFGVLFGTEDENAPQRIDVLCCYVYIEAMAGIKLMLEIRNKLDGNVE